ncbi:DMT family transporter [Polynucleobacter necessarius]|uniref:DMT family transporter n=1 Tax=Polynucleobacter necessarius TaxID=576610 RepID=UPI001E64F92B|nr:DMT family transporter [Polynucleobacter necessarius]
MHSNTNAADYDRLNQIGSPLVAQAGILGPVSTILMGYFILAEPITWPQISGMTLVITAMWLLVRHDAPRKKSPAQKRADDFDGAAPLN